MDVLAEYRRRAAECERLAREAITKEHRQTILQIAESWRLLADQRQRMGLAQDKANASGPGQQAASGRGDPKLRPRIEPPFASGNRPSFTM
jgi:hypothetical protein